jgi:hypothetical protein
MRFTPEQKQRIDVLIEGRVLGERRRQDGERSRHEARIAEIAELHAEIDRLHAERAEPQQQQDSARGCADCGGE